MSDAIFQKNCFVTQLASYVNTDVFIVSISMVCYDVNLNDRKYRHLTINNYLLKLKVLDELVQQDPHH